LGQNRPDGLGKLFSISSFLNNSRKSLQTFKIHSKW
jgi:hypothetical protein